VIEGAEAVRVLEASGVRLFVGVPDSLMKGFCNALDAIEGPSGHLVAANEGAAVATAAGHYLATGRPAVVYMQNSGLGNAVNPLSSLAGRRVYGIPMVLLVGWRGEPGVEDEPQHEHQGAITIDQLELLDVPTQVIGPGDDVKAVLEKTVAKAESGHGPVAIVVRKGTFVGPDLTESPISFSRMDALRVVVDTLPEETAFVATTGYTGRELALMREQRAESWERDMLMIGSMGHASALALGIAGAVPDRLVCCLDGDGAVAMHMGSLAVIGAERPSNLVHMVLNNGVHESVGGQPSALRWADLPGLARNLGYASSAAAGDEAELTAALKSLIDTSSGPALIEVRIGPGTVENLPRPSDFKLRATAMREWLTGGG
jgi:phosphonopyruvate decarboxylase